MKRCPTRVGAWTLSEVIFDLPRLQQLIAELEARQNHPDFWSDPETAQRETKRLARLRSRIEPYEKLSRTEQDLREIFELLALDADPETEREAERMAAEFLKELDDFELRTLLSGEHDDRNALLEINAGAGGSEACDWAAMLLRMYTRWCEKRGFRYEILSETPGDVTGYRRVNLRIEGPMAYGYLRSEHGVHRLVRISPFDASARRHTSFARVEVLPEFEESEVRIDEEDLKIETLRSGGAGGQHVNKTESAVRITHLPTGIVVQCQNERSQHKNRASAMAVLLARLAELERANSAEEIAAIKGENSPAAWGRQIRSYVMQPYTLVKDHRTGHETADVLGVLDGDIDGFIEAFLRRPPEEDRYIE